jgi:hypothetical protein
MGNIVDVKIIPENDTLIIREGKAMELKEPLMVEISGILDSPRRWIEKRISEFNCREAAAFVNRDKMSIRLIIDEKNFYRDVIIGSITPSPEFTKWGINNEEVKYHSQELAVKIKMNRYQFVSLEKATELVTIFQNLKAKVQREIDQSDNTRGTVKKNYSQVVSEMSIPEGFSLITPLFKGDIRREIKVEIVIDADTLKCSLVSPDAAYLLDTIRDQMIDAEIKQIGEIAPNIVIIEV